MARSTEPVSLIKRLKTKYWYYKLGDWKTYKSTGEMVKAEALKVALAALKEVGSGPTGPTFRRYAEPFFIWESCPHARRLSSEGKSVTRYHVKNMRGVLENHVLSDPIARKRISEIKRADILRETFTRTIGVETDLLPVPPLRCVGAHGRIGEVRFASTRVLSTQVPNEKYSPKSKKRPQTPCRCGQAAFAPCAAQWRPNASREARVISFESDGYGRDLTHQRRHGSGRISSPALVEVDLLYLSHPKRIHDLKHYT